MAEANVSSLADIDEAGTWGVTPGTPELTRIRIVNESIKHTKNAVQSAELRDDRMAADLIQVESGVEGPFNFEFAYGDFDRFLESALYSTYTVLNDVALNPITVSGQQLTGAAALFDNLKGLEGGWILIAGATTGSNNGRKRLIAVAADGSDITFVAGSLTGADAGETLTLTSDDLRNGTTEKSFTMERDIPVDGTSFFQLFTGCVMNALNLDFQVGQITTGSFGITGKVGAPGSSTIDTSGGVTEPSANSPFNPVDNIGTLALDDYSATTPTSTAMLEKVRQFTIALNNNIRGLDALGTLGNFDLGSGTIDLTGTLLAYFSSNVAFQDFVDHTYKIFSMEITDDSGNIYIITLPRINFSDANPSLEGINTDVMQPLEWTAIRDSLSDAQIIINRFAAP